MENKNNRRARMGSPITPHKGGRTSRLPSGKVTPDELQALESDRAARGLSWSDYVMALKREAADAARNQDIEKMLCRFPTNTLVKIYHVLPGLFRVGYSDNEYTYVPGSGSYYPVDEAIQKCLEALRANDDTKESEK